MEKIVYKDLICHILDCFQRICTYYCQVSFMQSFHQFLGSFKDLKEWQWSFSWWLPSHYELSALNHVLDSMRLDRAFPLLKALSSQYFSRIRITVQLSVVSHCTSGRTRPASKDFLVNDKNAAFRIYAMGCLSSSGIFLMSEVTLYCVAKICP